MRTLRMRRNIKGARKGRNRRKFRKLRKKAVG
jgi:hypothetical protein